MLRMTPSVSAEAAKTYFRNALSRGEYYTQEKIFDQEIVGLWGGEGAARLGLEGPVDRVAFEQLIDNMNPATGERLTPRTKDGRRVAYDCNFHVPKSVSAALELTGDIRIVEAFRDAIGNTMRAMESEMQTRVRKGGANEGRVTGNMIWAEFVHFTTRPVDGVPDFHLHQHTVVFNATWDPFESRWKAGEFGDLKRDAPYFQAAYHARLAENLRELGYDIEHRGDGWEIAGVPQSVIEKFSRRTDEIERTAEESGITDPDRKAELGAKTRKAKVTASSMEELRQEWSSRLDGDERRALSETRERAEASGPVGMDDPRDLDAAMAFARQHCFEQNSIVPEKRFMAAALAFGVGRVTPEAMRQRVETELGNADLLGKEVEGQRLITTREVLLEEQRMLATVRQGRGQHDPLKMNHEIRDAALSAEQREAVRHVLESSDSVVLVRGKAGVGKTRMMQEVARALEEAGVPLQATAPTAMATHEVLRDDGFRNAQTVAHVLGRADCQARVKGGVLWVDEAGLLSVPDMQRLVQLAESLDARLLLSGDTGQHRSVLRGDALRLLETESGLKAAELKEVRRQRVADYRLAAESLGCGDLLGGFERLEDLGAVHEIGESERASKLATTYLDSLAGGRSTLVVSPTHAEGREVTAAIRETLREQGRLEETDTTVGRLKNRHLSEAKKSEPRWYREGDVIQFYKNCRGGFRGGDRGEVLAVNDKCVTIRRRRDGEVTLLPLKTPSRFQVFEKTTLKIAAGDRIQFTDNGRSVCGKHRLNNGRIYGVKSIMDDGRIVLENGWVVPWGFGHINHGYCVTSDSSQGRTVDHVILALSESSMVAASLQQFYTSVTRGRFQISVFTDDVQKMLRSASRDSSRLSGTELMGLSASPQLALQHKQALGLWLSQQADRDKRRSANRQLQHQRSRRRQRRRNRDRDKGGFERER